MSQWGRRVCSACGYDISVDDFSRNQWAKGVGVSRCMICVQEGIASDSNGFETARENNCTKIEIDLCEIFAEGSFKYCAEGRYTGGQRTGQRCVAKWFKDGNDEMNDEFFSKDLDAVEQALRIITQWNHAEIVSGLTIRLNIPDKWTIRGTDCIVEPFIDDFTKFNSNTGWVNKNGNIMAILQALSHYSYHISSGQFVLCDLQGGISRGAVVLTDPVVMSRKQRFGPTDLGPRGMSSFFHHHHCNRYCRSEWTQPKDQTEYYPLRTGTFMESASDHKQHYSGLCYVQNMDTIYESDSDEDN
jgi:hypothetical protein